jgi:internalin A
MPYRRNLRPVAAVDITKGQNSGLELFSGGCSSMKNCLLVSLFFAGMAVATDNAAVPFHDPNLESMVRKFLPDVKAGEPLTRAQLESAVLVSGQGAPVTDLRGLEQCKNLRFLYLKDTQIADLSPLAKLDHLEALTIEGSKVRDLMPLAGLTKLNYLDLARNQISDLSPLANLKQLKHLYLSDNRIADLGPLQNLPALQYLHLDGNQISELQPLAKTKDLIVLDLRRNHISDLTPLGNLTEWRDLYLDQNQITDVGPLVAVTDRDGHESKDIVPIRTVSLAGNPLSASSLSREIPELRTHLFDLVVGKP